LASFGVGEVAGMAAALLKSHIDGRYRPESELAPFIAAQIDFPAQSSCAPSFWIADHFLKDIVGISPRRPDFDYPGHFLRKASAIMLDKDFQAFQSGIVGRKLPALARPAKAVGKEPIQLVYPELADNIWIWFTLAFSPPERLFSSCEQISSFRF
jgi:hypothetical protein